MYSSYSSVDLKSLVQLRNIKIIRSNLLFLIEIVYLEIEKIN